MAKTFLVVVESPGKIKKLKHLLGESYEIMASMGHVVDLPNKDFGIDLNTMTPRYITTRVEVAKRLKAEAKKPYQAIYLASDPDREGEAIAHHLATLIARENPTIPLLRVTFDSITSSAIQHAFNHPRAINAPLVQAQEARRLLDRLVGYPASRFLWQSVQGKGLSAGRVQSVALRLVVERDTAIKTFVPQEYWTITGTFEAKNGTFTAQLSTWRERKVVLATQAQALAILEALAGALFKIASLTPKAREQKPPAPFTTSTLQQVASAYLKLSPDATMKLAQQLYEGGFITYMRTDSPAVSPEGVKIAHHFIQQHYGELYVGKHKYGAKGNAQEAHECIRPTEMHSFDSVRLACGKEGDRASALYDLIAKRFLASQMASAVHNELHVTVAGGEAVFSAKGSQVAFDGFLRLYTIAEDQESTPRADNITDEDSPATPLPALTVAESVKAKQLVPRQHFTKPPNVYTEALLVKALEQVGVGRPSTYAQTVSTLKKRGYVTLEKRKISPTPLGHSVNTALLSRLSSLFDVTFTAQMETALDDIACGKQASTAYLKAFWAKVAPLFGESIVQATVTPARTPKSSSSAKKPSKPTTPVDPALGTCPQCGKALVKRTSKYGDFLGCSGFPRCKFIQK